jgi:4-hydroxybenzoate polyprenyltransferase
LIIIISLLYKIPDITLIAGAILAFLVLVYFISLKLLEGSHVYHKEVIASLVYTTGVFIAPVSNYDGNIGLDLYILFIEFFLLALSNMLIFSIFESDVDKHEGFHSLVISYGESRVKAIVWLSISMVYVIGFAGIITHIQPVFWATQVIMILMNTILVIIFSNKKYFIIHSRFRIAGDAIFFLPLIYLFFPNVL